MLHPAKARCLIGAAIGRDPTVSNVLSVDQWSAHAIMSLGEVSVCPSPMTGTKAWEQTVNCVVTDVAE